MTSSLEVLELEAIRRKENATFSSSLGSVSFFFAILLSLLLPSPFRFGLSNSIPLLLFAFGGYLSFLGSVICAIRCLYAQGLGIVYQFQSKYLCNSCSTVKFGEREDTKPETSSTKLDKILDQTFHVEMQRPHRYCSPVTKRKRSVFDPAVIETIEDVKNFLMKVHNEKGEEVDDASISQQSFGAAVGPLFPNQIQTYNIFCGGESIPRLYQASSMDFQSNSTRKTRDREDALRTASSPLVAWQQLEEYGLQMFMHLYCRNVRRLLACHVKDVVEAFTQNITELNECGVLVDLLLRRVPVQPLLCPHGQTHQLTNVSLSDMCQNLTKNHIFYSKQRGVFLFDEHLSLEKYLNIGDSISGSAGGSSNIGMITNLERQQYVLQRLFMLSRDRNLDRFRWNKGSSWKAQEWNEILPTDAEILMNVFCCMLDNMLPADSERDRPFWRSYFLSRTPLQPLPSSFRNRLFLVHTHAKPPHFKVLVRGAVREIVPGEENCFHAIVVFLHAGHLESINLHRILEQVFDVAK